MSGEVLIILCTFPNVEQARQIGTVLVERQLAACVNFLPGVESVYRWQGKVETANEVLAIFKTTQSMWPKFEGMLAELHPYEVPEIVAIAPERISGAYQDWVIAECAGFSSAAPQD
jgi:periplasmic divalent cation tolerance protein